MHPIEDLFDLNESVQWIKINSFKCIALELPVYLLKYSANLINYLNSKLNETETEKESTEYKTPIEFYVIVLNCCSVDYVSPRHLNGKIDAIIRFGKCCLASLPKGIIEHPVLFMFENFFLNDKSMEFMSNYFKDEFNLQDSLLIMDTNYLTPSLNLIEQLNLEVSVGKFIKFTSKWTFTEKLKDHFIDSIEDCSNDELISNKSNPNESISNNFRFYNFILNQDLNQFKRLYYIGDRVPNSIKILSLLDVVHLNPEDQSVNKIQTSKELMKRCSLIEKVKSLNRLGVVFTHSYPNVNPFIKHIKALVKRKRKQVNFITLVQTTDEFRLGNFTSIESLVIINKCHCSFLIDTINLHIPLINYEEFKISCGLKLDYGQVKWNEELDDENELEDELNEEVSNQIILDDRNTALVESYFNENRWFGLEVNAGQDKISDLKQGLKGIAMNYNEFDSNK